MNTVVACDEHLYQLLNRNFPIYNDHGDIIGVEFNCNDFDNYWVTDPQYLLTCLNPLDGIRQINVILIQKSWYHDLICWNISLLFQISRPETRGVFIMDTDEDSDYFQFRSRKTIMYSW